MIKRLASLALLALLPAPVLAGDVFVPLASNQTSAGTLYQTRVWVSNPGRSDRRFATLFIEQGVDGTTLEQSAGGTTVPAGGTVVLSSIAPSGKTGMLAIGGADQLVVEARLQAIAAGGQVLSSAAVPAVSLANATPAGGVAHLLGLGQTRAGIVSDFSLLNLSRTAAQCSVQAFRADNSQIGQTAVVALLPMSKRDFSSALAILGETSITDARFAVSCDQQFFAYTLVHAGGQQVSFVQPSQTLAGEVVPGGPSPGIVVDSGPGPGSGSGAGPSPGGQPGSGAVTLQVPGTFLAATDASSYIGYNLATRPGVRYRRVTVEYDLYISSFNRVLLFTGVSSVRRPAKARKDRVLYYGLQLVNRNAKTVLDLGIQDRLARSQGPWLEGHTYHLKVIYDLGAGKVTLQAADQAGGKVYTLSGPTLHPDLSANANPIVVDFGQTGIGDGAYGPPIGWRYSNLNVRLDP